MASIPVWAVVAGGSPTASSGSISTSRGSSPSWRAARGGHGRQRQRRLGDGQAAPHALQKVGDAGAVTIGGHGRGRLGQIDGRAAPYGQQQIPRAGMFIAQPLCGRIDIAHQRLVADRCEALHGQPRLLERSGDLIQGALRLERARARHEEHAPAQPARQGPDLAASPAAEHNSPRGEEIVGEHQAFLKRLVHWRHVTRSDLPGSITPRWRMSTIRHGAWPAQRELRDCGRISTGLVLVGSQLSSYPLISLCHADGASRPGDVAEQSSVHRGEPFPLPTCSTPAARM
jgi:hypothetical protein